MLQQLQANGNMQKLKLLSQQLQQLPQTIEVPKEVKKVKPIKIILRLLYVEMKIYL